MAMDLGDPDYHINWSNVLGLESKTDMQKRGRRRPSMGTRSRRPVRRRWSAENEEERDEDDEFGGNRFNRRGPGGSMR